MATSLMTSFYFIAAALLCLLPKGPLAVSVLMEEDAATSLVQMAVLASNNRRVLDGGSALHTRSFAADECEGQVTMNLEREVVTNNLGGQGPTGGDPVIHIRNFVDLMNGQTVDLVVSISAATNTTYETKKSDRNGLKGEFTNINMKTGTTDFIFTFQDATTGAPKAMPAFNLSIYDLDGRKNDPYTEIVSIDNADFTSYKLTDSTDVVVNSAGAKTEFGSSAYGEGCDNPSSIETLGVVECENSGIVDQRDRSVALEMIGGRSSYHITLTVNKANGRNFLFGVPAYFNKVCRSTPAPTGSPTGSPTLSPTGFPTGSPTFAPTGSPTGSPTTFPTGSPTGSPTGFPTDSPTSSPTGFPTRAPTVSPTASDVTTSFGDPHVSNLKGERFDILRNGNHTFLVIPRGSIEEKALLYVTAKVDPLEELCSGVLYVTSLRFTGGWLGDVGSLDFSTSVQGPMDAQQAIKIRKGASAFLNISDFKETIPQSLAEITEFHPAEPRKLSQHVETLLVKLKLGPTIAKVRMVYQKEKSGFSNSLWLTTSGMRRVYEDVGGILGLDDHRFAASSPSTCSVVGNDGAFALLGRPIHRGSIHAAASFEDDSAVS